jgi:hypothetical protein
MEKQDYRISIKTVWVLVIGYIVLTTIGAVTKIQHWEFSQILMMAGLILLFSSWIIVISDMTKNKIYNKTFWIMSMFILPGITPIFYIIQKNRLIRLGSKFEQQ